MIDCWLLKKERRILQNKNKFNKISNIYKNGGRVGQEEFENTKGR
jgi:hypothetical protein